VKARPPKPIRALRIEECLKDILLNRGEQKKSTACSPIFLRKMVISSDRECATNAARPRPGGARFVKEMDDKPKPMIEFMPGHSLTRQEQFKLSSLSGWVQKRCGGKLMVYLVRSFWRPMAGLWIRVFPEDLLTSESGHGK
jgi:hypothetical protein